MKYTYISTELEYISTQYNSNAIKIKKTHIHNFWYGSFW